MTAPNETACARPLTGRTVLICLLAFFAIIFIVNGIMTYAAISTFGGVETASSYQAGLSFGREAEAARVQDTRHWQVKANVQTTGGKTALEIDARDAAGQPLSGLAAAAFLHRPTDARADRTVVLSQDASGHFRGAGDPVFGQWDVVIELSRGGERVFRSRNRVVLLQE